MAKKGRIADPHAAREAERYDNPIPSREVILKLLSDADQPLNHNQICRELALENDAQLKAEQAVYLARRETENLGRSQLLPQLVTSYSYQNSDTDTDSQRCQKNCAIARLLRPGAPSATSRSTTCQITFYRGHPRAPYQPPAVPATRQTPERCQLPGRVTTTTPSSAWQRGRSDRVVGR